MIAIRNSSPALQLGDFSTLLVDDAAGVYAFQRSYQDEQVVVALNNSAAARAVTLKLDGGWVNLLEGEEPLESDGATLSFTLEPLAGAVFGRNNARSTVGGK